MTAYPSTQQEIQQLQKRLAQLQEQAEDVIRGKLKEARKVVTDLEMQLSEITGRPSATMIHASDRKRWPAIKDEQLEVMVLFLLQKEGQDGMNAKTIAEKLKQNPVRIRGFIKDHPKVPKPGLPLSRTENYLERPGKEKGRSACHFSSLSAPPPICPASHPLPFNPDRALPLGPPPNIPEDVLPKRLLQLRRQPPVECADCRETAPVAAGRTIIVWPVPVTLRIASNRWSRVSMNRNDDSRLEQERRPGVDVLVPGLPLGFWHFWGW